MKHTAHPATLIATLALASGALATAPGAAGPSASVLSADGFTLTGRATPSPGVMTLAADGLTLTGAVRAFRPTADVAEPFGVLDAQDKIVYMNLLGAEDTRADLAEPWGVINAADLSEFIRRFDTDQPDG